MRQSYTVTVFHLDGTADVRYFADLWPAQNFAAQIPVPDGCPLPQIGLAGDDADGSEDWNAIAARE